MFPRGSGPLVSILLPTRGRTVDLSQAVDSCYSLAKHKEGLEFLFKLDEDDPDSIAAVQRFADLGLNVRAVISPRGNGYRDMHLWLNNLASQATGDWLFVFNDDARMIRQDWDSEVLNVNMGNPWIGLQEVCYILAQTKYRSNVQEFFFLRRATFELLGHIAPVPHVDGWIYWVMNFIRCFIDFGVPWVEHFDRKDSTRAESDKARMEDFLNDRKIQWLALQDVAKLLSRLQFLERTARWQKETPPSTSINLWRPEGATHRKAHEVIMRESDGRLVNFTLQPGEKFQTPQDWTPPCVGEYHILSQYDYELKRSVHP